MDTTAAATLATVTPRTIRRWAATARINAVKTVRGWDVDEASLRAHMATRATQHQQEDAPVELSIEGMLAIGGSRWTKNGKDRVYINDWQALIDFEVSYYNSGNIQSGSLGGEGISNAEAKRLIRAVDKVYYDVADGEIHIMWGDGSPSYISRSDIAKKIDEGIRAAIAAA